MGPDIHPNYWAILVAVAATMVLGFLWYGPIFGKAWMKEMGIPAGSKPDPKVMRRGLILMLIGLYVPLLLGAVAWENKSWKLFGINAAYSFVMLQLVAMILAFWR